jgi:hypothetical protein
MKKRIFLFLGIGLLVIAFGLAIFYLRPERFRRLTFAECGKAGGVSWPVDLYDPDICPACAEFRLCESEYNDFSQVCPECYGACQECQEQYSVAESCPECYGPCQECENKYLNEFESEEERFSLCPVCQECEICREDINLKKINCPACISCNECKEANKRTADIGDVCPQVDPCTECMNANFPYPDRCPDGREKIGEISDAATWFQCCR